MTWAGPSTRRPQPPCQINRPRRSAQCRRSVYRRARPGHGPRHRRSSQGRQLEAAIIKRAPVTLESLGEAKITELKVILKADFRGSIEAIRKELEKLHHDEVRIRLLHTGIGGITESDVQLALTSPDDTLILGFNTVPTTAAHALAEERGVDIRQYNIIYKLTRTCAPPSKASSSRARR